jgi:hypothetical protein
MLVHENKEREADMTAVMWLDRERRYFIATTSGIAEGRPYDRTRWRQRQDRPERVKFSVPKPQAVELYYSACSKIDRHDRFRQYDLMLERKFVTHDWSMRVNLYPIGNALSTPGCCMRKHEERREA